MVQSRDNQLKRPSDLYENLCKWFRLVKLAHPYRDSVNGKEGEIMTIKRNTTPTIPITIHMPFECIKKIEFKFKDENSEIYPDLLHKSYEKEKIKIKEKDEKKFIMLVSFSAAETLKFPEGSVFMDTRIVLEDGSIPETKIVCINVEKTFFGEDDTNG